jgi:RNA polymerase sigma factor (sigma-70 family)
LTRLAPPPNGGGDEVNPELLANCPAEFCKELVFAHWPLLQTLTRKRFKDENLVDQALLYVQRGLEDKDWRRVRAYQGRASFKTYLTQVASRLMLDFARTRFKRQHPPAWIIVRGFLYQRLFKLLCRERLSPNEATRTLVEECVHATEDGAINLNLLPEDVKRAIEDILSNVPDCGKPTEPRFVTLENIDNLCQDADEAHQISPEEHRIATQRDAFLEALRRTLGMGGDFVYAPDPKLADRFANELRTVLSLTSEERVFLRLIYYDGKPVTTAARTLGLPEKKAHYRHKQLLTKIRDAIEAAATKFGGLDVLADLMVKKE